MRTDIFPIDSKSSKSIAVAIRTVYKVIFKIFFHFFSFAISTLAEEISKKLHLSKTGSHTKFSFSPFAFSKER